MYDSVTFWLETRDARRVLDRVDDVREHTSASSGETTYSGRVGHLRLFCGVDRVRVSGSLPKYARGDNAESLSRADTERVLSDLSDHLGLPMREALVTSLEFGTTLAMTVPVADYFPLFGDARYYQRSHIRMNGGEGLYYTNRRRELVFYDKGKELASRRGRVGREPKEGNHLRYELRFRRRVPAQLGVGSVRGAMLHEEGFFGGLVDRWLLEYFSIDREQSVRSASPNGWGVREFKEYLAAHGVAAHGGHVSVMEMLRSAWMAGNLEKSQYHRMRAALRDLASSPLRFIASDLVLELDTKVREAADRTRTMQVFSMI